MRPESARCSSTHFCMRSAIGTAERFDGHEPTDLFRVDTGIADRDVAAERMRDDGDRRQLLLMDQLRQVVDIGGRRIVAVGGPLAVAMAAQIGRQDVPVLAQRGSHPVPIAAMVAPAMDEQKRRRARVAPVDVMQPEPLREIDARGRAGAVQINHRHAAIPRIRSDIARPPRAVALSPGRQAGVGLRSSASRSDRRAELNLGLSARLPMPRGRQLVTARWCHACYTPSRQVDDNGNLALCRDARKSEKRRDKRVIDTTTKTRNLDNEPRWALRCCRDGALAWLCRSGWTGSGSFSFA